MSDTPHILEYEDYDGPACPACNAAQPFVIGTLGNVRHYSCRQCGLEFHEHIAPAVAWNGGTVYDPENRRPGKVYGDGRITRDGITHTIDGTIVAVSPATDTGPAAGATLYGRPFTGPMPAQRHTRFTVEWRADVHAETPLQAVAIARQLQVENRHPQYFVFGPEGAIDVVEWDDDDDVCVMSCARCDNETAGRCESFGAHS